MKPFIRILHLEDSATDAELIHSMLEENGFTLKVVRVETSQAFFRELEKGPYDLIISDFTLPSYDGVSALRAAREKTPDVPFIFVSGTIGEQSAVDSLLNGATDYVLKHGMERLVPAVRRALREAEERRVKEAALEALLRSENSFRLLFENNPLPMWVYELETLRFLKVNDAAVAKYGYSSEEFLQMRITDIRPAQDVDRLMEDLKQPRDDMGRPSFWRHILKSGRLIDVEITSHALMFEGRTSVLVVAIDITERLQAEKLQRAVYRISQEAGYSPSTDALFKKVHEIIADVMPARNFYIAIYDDKEDVISFPYFVDEMDVPSPPQKSGKGLTEYVIRTGTTLLCNAGKHQELIDLGEAELVGEPSAIWLGVPLNVDGKTVGVMVVQDYSNEHAYEEGEKQILEFVSEQVARAIQRKRAEEALALTHNQIKTLHDNLDVALFSVDIVENRMLEVSSAHAKVFGYPPAKFFENPRLWYDLIVPEDKHIVDAGFPVLMAGKTLMHEFRIRRPDGQIAWIEARMKPTLNERGILVRLDGFASDVTARKHAEENLLLQTTYFQQLFENSPEGIVLMDDRNCVINTNAAFQKMFQYEIEELRGRPLNDFIVPEDRVEEATRIDSESLAGGTVQHETVRRRKDGTTVDVIIMGYPITIRNERVGIYGIYVDVTKYKKLQAQVLRTQRLESIGTLAGGIAHDLNNALGPIMLGVQVIEKHITDERAKRILESIGASAKRGASMVKQILAFARGFSGEFGILDPKHVIEEAQKIIRETFPKNIELNVHSDKQLWNVSGDSTQLHQLLINLCVNARDAMPSGGRLTINAENFRVDETYAQMYPGIKAGPHILLTVADTGSGMPKDVLEKIFDPFFTTKEPGKGTGLGLSTVDTIVKGHGGAVDVYSDTNRGTTFKVLLPALPATDAKTAVDIRETPHGSGEVLLVVDDEVILREMTKQTLEMFGYNVITAADGTEAITQFVGRRQDIQAVITDMAMPIMDGEATIRALRKIDPAIRIIATSGQHDTVSDTAIRRMEISRSLTKPFTAEQLLRVVSEVLGSGEKQ